MTIAIIGIDPGGRDAGVILRSTSTLLYAATVHRADVERDRFAGELLEAVDEARRHIPDGATLAAIGVEDVNEPSPHLGIIALEPVLTTAVLLGAVLGYGYDPPLEVIVVPPGDNGSAPLGAYPSELVGPTERHGAYGKLRHVRSAWDVAGTAAMILRARVRSRVGQ